MRKIITSSFIVFYVLCSFTFAQNVVNVTPNVINSLLDAVTAAQEGDVLVLERGGFYFNQGVINVTVPITIMGADGDGDLPLVQQAPKEDGSFGGQDFEVAANTTFKNIHFNGIRNSRTSATGRAIRLAAEQLRLVVDGCVFERFWLRTIDLNVKNPQMIHYKNNLHLWDGREDRIDNGRFFDSRGSSLDSLIVENNTFMNCNDRFIRNMGLPGILNYVKFDHNTFYGNIGYRPPFQFRTTKELIFTNNVVANVGLLGTDTVSNRINEIDYDEPRAICVFTITGTDTLGTTIDMRNNVVYTESRFTDLFAANPDTIQQAPLFNKQFEDLINVSEAYAEEELSFGRAPSLDSLIGDLQNYIAGGTNWSNTGFITRTEVLAPGDVDMSYGTTAAAYTGAENGFPVGDLNWYPDKKAEWENFVPTPAVVVVDGEKDEFYNTLTGPSDGYLQIQSFAFNDNGRPDDNADHSAHLWAAWDDTWFYVYTEVTDDIVSGETTNIWETDNLEIKVDGVPDTPGQNISKDFRLSALATGNVDNLSSVGETATQYFRKTTDNGYVLELAIKLSVLGGSEPITAAVGTKIGMGIGIHDNDSNARESSIMWAAVMLDAIWNTADYLGTLEFLADNKVNFIPTNNMTGVTNDIPFDGTVVGVEDTPNAIPVSYALEQNYPNPFNPTTEIAFSLPENGFVTLKVFNAIGQEVVTLVKENMTAGHKKVSFNAQNLTSGLYFYQLNSGKYSETKKMILMK